MAKKSKTDLILSVLKKDLIPRKDVLAAFVGRRGLDNIIPMYPGFRGEAAKMWETTDAFLNDLFDLLEPYQPADSQLSITIKDHPVLISSIYSPDVMLVVICHKKTDPEKILPQIEKTKTKITNIIESFGE